MMDASQIRAARALLSWKQAVLAEKAGLALTSVKNIERGTSDPRVSSLLAIQAAFETAGLVLLEPGDARTGGRGVRFRE